MIPAVVTLNVKRFDTPPPEHAPANWSSCLCDDCWADYLDLCDEQDGLSHPAA
jgi:hypothetical protein